MDNDFYQKLNSFVHEFPASWESGDRTPTHNKNVGGGKNSYHTKGKAMDLIYDSFLELYQAAEAAQSRFGGVEMDLTNYHLHVDDRPMENKWHVIKDLDKKYKSLNTYLTTIKV